MRGISGGTGRREEFKQAIAKPTVVGPETNPWYWNPNRAGVKLAPQDFMRKLKELGSELSCTWDPIQERWLIWSESQKVQTKLCQGWRLLFIVRGPDGEYQPLDERVFARLYAASVLKHGSGKEYFNRIVAEMERDKEKQEAQSLQERIDAAMPAFEHAQIKVAMRGKSSGSKFTTYHA